jgi:hypothetical protein
VKVSRPHRTVGAKEEDMFTGSRKAIVPGVLAGVAVLAGVSASSASGRVVPAVPDDTGLELGWGIRAAPQHVRARWTDPTFPPALVRIDAG